MYFVVLLRSSNGRALPCAIVYFLSSCNRWNSFEFISRLENYSCINLVMQCSGSITSCFLFLSLAAVLKRVSERVSCAERTFPFLNANHLNNQVSRLCLWHQLKWIKRLAMQQSHCYLLFIIPKCTLTRHISSRAVPFADTLCRFSGRIFFPLFVVALSRSPFKSI